MDGRLGTGGKIDGVRDEVRRRVNLLGAHQGRDALQRREDEKPLPLLEPLQLVSEAAEGSGAPRA